VFELADEAKDLSANVLTRRIVSVDSGVGRADIFEFQMVPARVIAEVIPECAEL